MNESHVSIDLAGVKAVDARFLGLLILFRKELTKRKKSLSVVGVSRTVERMFLLNDLKFLVSSGPGEQSLHRSRTGIDQLSLIGTSAVK
jgi:anti-anti-sigma regulatory factor